MPVRFPTYEYRVEKVLAENMDKLNKELRKVNADARDVINVVEPTKMHGLYTAFYRVKIMR